MAGIELGAVYRVYNPPQTQYFCFNDPSDPAFVGYVKGITGLDSGGIRENAQVKAASSGGYHGPFWADRRPWTISGVVLPTTPINLRSASEELMTGVLMQCLQEDGYLTWSPSDGSQRVIPFRTQQPFRATIGQSNVEHMFLVSGVTADWRIFSSNTETESNTTPNQYANLINDPSFEYDSFGNPPASWTAINGATLTGHNLGVVSGVKSAKLAIASGSANPTIYGQAIPVTAGATYTASVYYDVVTTAAGGSWTISMDWRDGSNNLLARTFGTSVTAVGAGQRVHVTAAAPANSANVTINVTFNGTPTSVQYAYIDAIMLNYGSLVDYTDGDQTGYQWTGAYGNSYTIQQPSVDLTNDGNVDSPFVATITGPLNGFVLECANTAKAFYCDYLVPLGHTVIVDFSEQYPNFYDTQSGDISGYVDPIRTDYTIGAPEGPSTFHLGDLNIGGFAAMTPGVTALEMETYTAVWV